VGRVIGLDVGTKTIGVAMSDPTRMLASPVTTVARQGVQKDVERLVALMDGRGVDAIVVGLPYELDGAEERSARLARQVGDALAARAGLPVTYVDERFTSVEASRLLIASGARRKKRKEVIDQAAAMLILQSFLDHGDWSAAKPPADP
jgi:putative Holliday junction resolvase